MKYEDLQFTINNNGKEIVCDILSLIRKSKNEAYVVFTDGEKDEAGEIILKYGRLVRVNDDFELRAGVDEYELETIKEAFEKDVVDLAYEIAKEIGD